MFKRRVVERRAGYSFLGHVRRVVRTYGVIRGVVLPLGTAALVAGAALADCHGADLTGPQKPKMSPTGGSLNDTYTIKQPAPIQLAFPALPPTDPCTGAPIVWDQGHTMLQGTIQVSTDDAGRLHVQFHFNSQGKATAPAGAPQWVGSQVYDSQDFTILDATNQDTYHFEWDMKMVQQGETSTGTNTVLGTGDDFYMHIVGDFGPQPTFLPASAQATPVQGKCQ